MVEAEKLLNWAECHTLSLKADHIWAKPKFAPTGSAGSSLIRQSGVFTLMSFGKLSRGLADLWWISSRRLRTLSFSDFTHASQAPEQKEATLYTALGLPAFFPSFRHCF